MKIPLAKNIFKKSHSDKTIIPYSHILHNHLKKKSKRYHKWHQNEYSRPVHRGVLLTYVILMAFVMILSPLASVHAASYYKTWTSQADFTTNVTNTNGDTTTTPGSVKLGVNPSPSVTFDHSIPAAIISSPKCIFVDSSGLTYICDSSNSRILVFSSDGTFLRKFGSSGSGDGQFSSLFTGPSGIALDSSGNIYIADIGNNRIQVFNNAGTFLRKFGSAGSSNGQLSQPYKITLDTSDNIYVSETGNNRVQVFNNSGSYLRKFGSSGKGNGQFNSHSDVILDSSNNIYVADSGNNRVQVFDNNGTFLRKFGGYSISTIASAPTAGGSGYAVNNILTVTGGVSGDATVTVTGVDGSGAVTGLSLTTNGNGSVYTAGTGKATTGGTGNGCTVNITALVSISLAGQLNQLKGIARDSSNNLYMMEYTGDRVSVFDTSGNFVRVIPSTAGTQMALSPDGNMYIIHSGSSEVMVKVYSNMGVSIREFGGNNGKYTGSGWGDGGIALDGSKNAYLIDSTGKRITILDSNGNYIRRFGGTPIATIASAPTAGGMGYSLGDVLTVTAGWVGGTATVTVTGVSGGVITGLSLTNNGEGSIYSTGTGSATMGGTGSGCTIDITSVRSGFDDKAFRSYGIDLDSTGNIYVGDNTGTVGYYVKVFNNSGTYLRKFGGSGTADGKFNGVGGVVLDANGNIYVVDDGNKRIQVFDNAGNYLRKFGSAGTANGQFNCTGSSYHCSIALDTSKNIYVADDVNRRVQVFDNNGNFLRKFGGKTISTIAAAPTVGGTGYTNGDVLTVTGGVSGEATVTVTGVDGTGAVIGLSLTTSGNGSVYTTGTGKATTGGTGNGCTVNITAIVSTSADGQLSSIKGITLDLSNNIYVVDYSRVQVFNNNGTYLRKFGSNGTADGQFNYAYDVALDATGKTMYVPDAGRIQVFYNPTTYYSSTTLSGTGLQTNAGGEAIWTNLAWNASDIPTGTSIKFNTRTSNDGSTWSAWGSDITGVVGANSQNLSITDSQYLDIQLTLTGGDVTPTFDDFTLSYTINGPPVVSNVTASQSTATNSYGKVNIGFTVSDSDNDTATIYYYYGTGIVQTGTFSNSDTTLNVNNTDNTPATGTIAVEDEMITYSGKTATAFTGLTRAALGTKAVSHVATTAVYTKCTTTTGTGLQNSGVGNPYTGTWDVKTDLDGVYLPGVILKVMANDGQLARMIGSATSASFVLDAKNPTVGANPLVITNRPKTNDTTLGLTLDASDNSGYQMMISTDSNFTLANWVTYAPTPSILTTAPDGVKTVYVKYRDIYGNTLPTTYTDTITLDTTSGTPANVMLLDASDIPNGDYQLVLSWRPIADSDFVQYSIERSVDNATSFAQVATFNNRQTNAYTDQMLSKDNTYYYRIRSQDDVGNWSPYSPTLHMKPAGLDQTPPSITGPDPNATALPYSAAINWLTNELSDSYIEYGTDNTYGFIQGTVTLDTTHVVNLVGLVPKTTYHYRVRSTDASGNRMTGNELTFMTPIDLTKVAPTLVGADPSVSTAPYTATVTWTTDKAADSVVEYGSNTSYGETKGSIDLGTGHEVTIIGLTQETTYHYRVRSTDTYGNLVTSGDFTFRTTKDMTKVAPVITGPNPQATPTPYTATIAWLTDKDADSFVEYGLNTSYGSIHGTAPLTKTHSVEIPDLTPETTYHFRVRSTDTYGNLVTSNDFTFVTPKDLTKVPPIITGPNPEATTTPYTANIDWLTDKVADSYVEFGSSISYDYTQGSNDLTLTHSVMISGLTPETTYHFRVKSTDSYGNSVTGSDFTFRTGLGPDLTPPQITGPNPSVTNDATTATISWLTNENSDSFIEFGPTASYGNTQGIINAVTNHSVDLVGLDPDTTYHFRVRSTDPATNIAVGNDFTFKTLVLEEKTSIPTITGATAQKEGADPEEVTIIWTTDKYSTSQVQYGINKDDLNQSSPVDSSLNKTHYIYLKKLLPNTRYYYRAVSVDEYGNKKLDETKYFVTAQTGTGVPKVSAVEATDITLNSAIISWETTVVATSIIEYGADNNYGSKIEDQSLGSTTKHLIRLKDLKEGVKYHYRVQGQSTGGVLVSSDDYVFSSLTKPTISDISIKDIGSIKAVVTWKTDTEADSFVDYGTTTLDASQGRSEEVKDHAVTLSNLVPATEYKIQLKSRDKYGNQAISDTKTFKTIIDTTAPIIKDLKSETSIITDSDGSSKAQAIISWSTDEPATSQVKYAAGVTTDGNYTNSTPEEPTLTTSHIVIISNIKPSSTYHMKIVSKDASDNIGVSDDYTVLTQGQEKSLVQYILQILEERFAWVNGFKLFSN